MRKALILTVLALFGSEALAQKSFRHAPTVALDDLQDNEMTLNGAINEALKHYGNAHRIKFDEVEDNNLFTRPMKKFEKFDDIEDNEMARFGSFGGRGTVGENTVLINRPTTRMGMMDDFEDDILLDQYEVFMLLGDGRFLNDGGPKPRDTFSSQNPGFLGSGNTGYSVEGGRVPQGGIASTGSGQFVGNIGNTGAQYIVGGSVSYSPGSPVSITPHVGVKASF